MHQLYPTKPSKHLHSHIDPQLQPHQKLSPQFGLRSKHMPTRWNCGPHQKIFERVGESDNQILVDNTSLPPVSMETWLTDQTSEQVNNNVKPVNLRLTDRRLDEGLYLDPSLAGPRRRLRMFTFCHVRIVKLWNTSPHFYRYRPFRL